jgi:hypothetical protein
VAQLLNVVYSIATTILLLGIADSIAPGNAGLKRTALLLLGMLPVYYRTFAFVRPEPLLTCLSLATLAMAPAAFAGGFQARRALGLGGVLGLSLLARQQAFFVAGAVAGFALLQVRRGRGGLAPACGLGLALLAALAVGGWFYGAQLRESGSVLAFSPGLQPMPEPTFFWGTGNGVLFRDPVRPAFRHQLLPVLYSETWGDHGCYFLVYGSQEGRPVWGTYLEEALVRRPRWLRTNRWAMGRWLGRVNLVSLVPTAVFLLGMGAGVAALWSWVRRRTEDRRTGILALLTLAVLATLTGYLLLHVLFYRRPTGSLIKATYVLPAFPPAALLGAALLQRLSAWKPRLHRAILAALVLVAVHNAPAYVTRYRLDGRGKMVPSAGEVGARDVTAPEPDP